jgi:hypothetical protein
VIEYLNGKRSVDVAFLRITILLLLTSAMLAQPVWANSTGVSGSSTEGVGCGNAGCHDNNRIDWTFAASFIGPLRVDPGSAATYSFRLLLPNGLPDLGPPGPILTLPPATAGLDVSVGAESGGASASLASLTAATRLLGGEITHQSPLAANYATEDNVFNWQFDLSAANDAGRVTLQGCGVATRAQPLNHDDFSRCATATVDINRSPNANDDARSVNENSGATSFNLSSGSQQQITANDTSGTTGNDGGDDIRIYGVCSTSTPIDSCDDVGNASYSSDGNTVDVVNRASVTSYVRFTPAAGFSGPFAFRYVIRDSLQSSIYADSAIVTINVVPVPDGPGPSVLLIDDDGGDTILDARGAFASALENRSEYTVCRVPQPQNYDANGCDIWDTVAGEPSASTLDGYQRVIWFSGARETGAGPGPDAETALQTYLDGGGCLIVSSENYASEARESPPFGELTPFMTNYLGLEAASIDRRVESFEGRYRFSGLDGFDQGSNNVLFATDPLHPVLGANARTAFFSQQLGSVAVYNEGANGSTIYRTLTLGFSFARLGPNDASNPNNLDHTELLNAALEYCDTGLRSADNDLDGDGIPDAQDEFPLNIMESRDFDGDGLGDGEDEDEDNDGLVNDVETANGCNPRYAYDAMLDDDGDGYSNRLECRAGTDANSAQAQEIPQEFTLLSPANGDETDAWVIFEWVGSLDPTDQYRLCLYEAGTLVQRPLEEPGQHFAYANFDTDNGPVNGTWTVVDGGCPANSPADANAFTVLDADDGNPSGEGNISVITGVVRSNESTSDFLAATVRVVSQQHIPRRVSEGSHIAVSDDQGRYIVLGLDTNPPISVSAVSAGFEPGEADTAENPRDDGNDNDLFDLTFVLQPMSNNSPLAVEFAVSQNGGIGELIFQDQGTVRVVATVLEPDEGRLYTYDWSATDNDITPEPGTGDGDEFRFDPSSLAPRFYSIQVTVSDDGTPARSGSAELLLNLQAIPPGDESRDTDGDRIPEYLDITNVPGELQLRPGGAADNHVMTVEGGSLRLGNTAFLSGTNGALITQQDLNDSFPPRSHEDPTHTHIGGLFDFEITGLSNPGGTARVVIPLTAPIPPGAVYRKFDPYDESWHTFLETPDNQVHSAALAGDGKCPAVQSADYTPGLTQGHVCVRLTLNDGGPNDAHPPDDLFRRENGVIADPGAVGYGSNSGPDPDPDPDPDFSGCIA